MEPIQLILAPFDVYVAAVGTAFPGLDDTPNSALWTLLGASGARDYDESGVTIQVSQTIEYIRTYKGTGPRKAARTAEELKVSFTLLDMRPEMVTMVIHNRAVTTGTQRDKYVGLFRGTSIYEFALLVKGLNASPKIANGPAQFEIPRAIHTGSPSMNFSKSRPGMMAMEWMAMEDENATTEAERFGRFRVKYLAGSASASASPSSSGSPSVSPSAG